MTSLDESEQLEYIVSLQRQLQDYKYGVVKNGRLQNGRLQGMKSAEEWNKYYRYMSPKEFERYHGGGCWDYVAYQTEKLMKKGIKFSNYYLEFLDDPDHGTHTITVCVVGRNYVYMESSFKSIAGVYISDHLDDILDFVLTEMHKLKKGAFSKRHTIRRYMYMMQYGCDCETFMNWMYSNEVVREDSPNFKETSIGNRIIKKDTEPYYRVTYKGIGIYEAFKQLVPERVWIRFLKSEYATWLPKPPGYTDGYQSYFTSLGYLKFKQNTLPFMTKYLDKNKITVNKYQDVGKVIYRDLYQVVTIDLSRNQNYYFVSESSDIKSMVPRIPDNYMTRHGYEDSKTPRVCFAPSINSCLMALSQKCTGMELYVYIPDGNYEIYHPSVSQVPDVNITGEVWIKSKVRVKKIGKIKVIGDKGLDGHPYRYGNKTAELYDWNWKWIEKYSGFDNYFHEGYVMNEEDIYYNKDKFDSGEINLCFITGHSGSGKSSMGKSMKSDDIEYCDLDTVVDLWYMYLSHDNLSQYGPLIYSFFTGKGKKYLHNSKEELTKDPYSDISKENFGTGIIQDFIKHAKSYAKNHTDKKFVIDGVWLYSCIKPNELDDYAVYIKGTSVTISRIRAAKRDSQNAGNKIDIMKSFIKNISNISRWKYFIIDEKMIKSWRNHFSKLEKDKPVTESKKYNGFDNYFREGYVINERDIYYNKDKFDSGEINLCFITGHSGSGKSTMGNSMQKDNVEHYDLDDVVWNKMHFTMANLKEYGDLIYSFFSGPGKKYFYTPDDVKSGKHKEIGGLYEEKIINDFVTYAMNYAKNHKNKQFVLEGIWLYEFIEPSKLKDYAVYIKGTSALISTIRAASRDSKEDYPDKKDKIKRFKSWWSRFKVLFCGGIETKHNGFVIEKKIKKYRQYFSKLEKDKPVTESKKCDRNLRFMDISNPNAKKYLLQDSGCKKFINFYLKSNVGELIFDVDNDALVGTIFVRTDKGQEGFIHSLWINKDYRGCGLSHKLVKDAINKYHGCDLTVLKDNKIAINLYKKHGFVMDHSRDTKEMYYMILKSHLKK